MCLTWINTSAPSIYSTHICIRTIMQLLLKLVVYSNKDLTHSKHIKLNYYAIMEHVEFLFPQ